MISYGAVFKLNLAKKVARIKYRFVELIVILFTFNTRYCYVVSLKNVLPVAPKFKRRLQLWVAIINVYAGKYIRK